jgi:hypothetical protein
MTARFDFFAHQGDEDFVGGDGVVDLHFEQAAHRRVHGGFPELFGVHFAQAFVALDAEVALGFVEQPVEGVLEVADGGLGFAAMDFGAGADQSVEDGGGFGELFVVAADQEVAIRAAGIAVSSWSSFRYSSFLPCLTLYSGGWAM